MGVKHFVLENPSLCNFCCDFMICCSWVFIPLFWWGDKSNGGQGLNQVEGEQKYLGGKIRRKGRPVKKTGYLCGTAGISKQSSTGGADKQIRAIDAEALIIEVLMT